MTMTRWLGGLALVTAVVTAGVWLVGVRGNRLRLMIGLDREIPNTEFRTVAAALGPHLIESDVRALVQKESTLRFGSISSGMASLVTPPQWDARNWIGWLEFGPDGHLLAVRYGFVDFLLAKPEDHGLPKNACWAPAEACKTIRLARLGPGY
jgi:hypothetical protein